MTQIFTALGLESEDWRIGELEISQPGASSIISADQSHQSNQCSIKIFFFSVCFVCFVVNNHAIRNQNFFLLPADLRGLFRVSDQLGAQ